MASLSGIFRWYLGLFMPVDMVAKKNEININIETQFGELVTGVG